MHDDMQAAWKRIYGTNFDPHNLGCTHFANGWNAAEGRS